MRKFCKSILYLVLTWFLLNICICRDVFLIYVHFCFHPAFSVFIVVHTYIIMLNIEGGKSKQWELSYTWTCCDFSGLLFLQQSLHQIMQETRKMKSKIPKTGIIQSLSGMSSAENINMKYKKNNVSSVPLLTVINCLWPFTITSAYCKDSIYKEYNKKSRQKNL